MTPIDLILWALAAAVAVIFVGLALVITIAAVNTATGRSTPLDRKTPPSL